MIKHIVMWKVRGDTLDARRATGERIKQQFEGLRSLIPGLRTLEVGLDVSGASHACDVVLYTEFDSPEALKVYADHSEHRRVRRELGDQRVAGFQVDYVIDEEPDHA